MYNNLIKIFLRVGLALGFLSATADRFGFWNTENSAWGNWDIFLEYTQFLNPLLPESMIPVVAIIATVAEIVFGIGLLIGFKTAFFAKLSGFLLLFFALAMAFTSGIKGVFDYSVLTASAAAFSLSLIKEKYMELDLVLDRIK
ncbi:DoxX family protein [Flavobacteriales bacterium 34_180_T64]|nr:DoxX family protein [Flavobacteriales bacterium 34_180_T64]